MPLSSEESLKNALPFKNDYKTATERSISFVHIPGNVGFQRDRTYSIAQSIFSCVE